MKKMKTRTKLVGAVAALTVAVAMSAGTTFAWFTQNSTSTIGSIEANVKTAGSTSVYVAAGHSTSGTFKASLSSSDLTDYINGALDAATISGQNSSTGAIEYVTVDGTTAVNEATASIAGYLKIPVTIKTDAYGTAVYITEDSEVTKPDTMTTSTTVTMWGDGANATYNSQTYAAGDTLTAYAYNATRVGFTERTSDGTAGGTPSTAGTAKESDVYVWSPNETNYDGREATAEGDRDVDENGGTSVYTNYWKNNLAGDYYDSVNGTTHDSQVGYTNYIAYEEGASSNEICTTASVDGSEAGYSYVYIYIWLEGTDGDCFNNILSQKISVSLTLTADTSLIYTA